MIKFKAGTKVKIIRGTRHRVKKADIGVIAKVHRAWMQGIITTGFDGCDVRMPDGRLVGFYHNELESVKPVKLKRCIQWK